jgi:hypothetical protein
LRSFDPLRRDYSVVLGRETSTQLNNGIIVGRRGAPFLRMMLEAYRSYVGARREMWGYFPTILPHQLADIFPHLVHVEETSIARPNWHREELKQLYVGRSYNWTSNYCVHVWSALDKSWLPPTPRSKAELAVTKSTLGQIMKHALYGDKDRHA